MGVEDAGRGPNNFEYQTFPEKELDEMKEYLMQQGIPLDEQQANDWLERHRQKPDGAEAADSANGPEQT